MARKLVICLDGTGNEIGSNLSNVLKLYKCLEKNDEQLVWYDPGVGTIGKPGWWSALRLRLRNILGLALGLGLDENLLDAYSWLCRTWQPGDEVYLFGFSRGAYTARVLAGFIHMCGLLWPDQLNLCGYALVAYKRAADDNDLEIGYNFGRIAGSRRITIRFVGAWDTVSSVIVPRPDRFYLPSRQKLPFTRENPSVRTFRHAIAIDERRRMFRLNHWKDPQPHHPDPRNEEVQVDQDIRQVWFAGVHADVGGGYAEKESGLSKYPLLWMIGEAQAAGLAFDARLVRWLGEGVTPANANPPYDYVAPDAAGELHRSLKGPWWLLEPIPQRSREREWPRRRVFLWLYFPWAEPRPIPNRPWRGVPADEPFLVHSSALARIARRPDYRPVNLPERFEVETAAGPPEPQIPPRPYRPPSLGARLRSLFAAWPAAKAWAQLPKECVWLLPLLGAVGGYGGFVRFEPVFTPAILLVALIAFLVPALVEEGVFRGALLKPPTDGVSGLGPAALSALLFALWHPLQTLVLRPEWIPWARFACTWPFLLCAAALGFACARLVLSSRSIWPAVVLHWLVIAIWLTMFGGAAIVGRLV